MKKFQSFRTGGQLSGQDGPDLKHAYDLKLATLGEGSNNPYLEIAAWGAPWLNYLGEHFKLVRVGLALAGEGETPVWIAGWPEDVPSVYEAVPDGTPELFPLKAGGQTLGWLAVVAAFDQGLDQETLERFTGLLPIMADGLQRELGQNRLQEVEYSINHILHSNLNAEKALPQVLDLLSGVLKADVVMISSRFPSPEKRDLLIVHGMDYETATRLRGSESQGTAGVILDRMQPVWIEDLHAPPAGFEPLHHLIKPGFRAYLAVPVIGRNESAGVLEILWREYRPRDSREEVFLLRSARQIALSLERSALFSNLRHANQDILKTYNSVFESLTHILSLRDHETEAHTQRVKRLTMRLVEHLNIPPEQWGGIERGALLHDIGKLGIPDAILLKPGSLTEAEHRMMQLHVTYGYSILSSITNTRQTLDLVLYHHERWDGKGYPDGLRGEHIPLAARLFAVMDVYDALTSDRPYRTAWLHSQAIDYLKQEAGRQFDPRMVSAFLEIAGEHR